MKFEMMGEHRSEGVFNIRQSEETHTQRSKFATR